MTRRLAAGLLALTGLAGAQSDLAVPAARAWRETHERAIPGEFMGLLALPNLARDMAAIGCHAAPHPAMAWRARPRCSPCEVS